MPCLVRGFSVKMKEGRKRMEERTNPLRTQKRKTTFDEEIWMNCKSDKFFDHRFYFPASFRLYILNFAFSVTESNDKKIN